MVGNNAVGRFDYLGLKFCVKNRIDYEFFDRNLGSAFGYKLKFKAQLRGTLNVCDDGTRTLTGEAVGIIAGKAKISPLFNAIISGEIHGKFNATWCSGFRGGEGELDGIGWVGLEVDGGLARLSAEGGLSASWKVTAEGDSNSVTFSGEGRDVYLNVRVKGTVGWGRWAWTEEVVRMSARLFDAPDWSITNPIP
jgi:hypothetical protein